MKDKKYVSIALLIIAGVIILFLLGGAKNDSVNTNELNVNENQVEEIINNQNENMEQDTNNENSKAVSVGDTITVNYTGRLSDGTVFDSNILPEFMHVEPFTFTVGAGQVIAGWEEGFIGMKVGEKKTLTISPEKGYGNMAIGKIPANSTLIFDVELVGVE